MEISATLRSMRPPRLLNEKVKDRSNSGLLETPRWTCMSEYVRERATPLFNDRVSRVSTSLCRFIFEIPKVNDALLFMTILSTDLKALKRRGYNGAPAITFHLPQVADLCVIHQLVDRILRQQKAEREAAEKARAETRASLISNPPEITMSDTLTKMPTTQTKIPPPASTATKALPSIPPPATSGSAGPEQSSKRSRPSSAIHELGRLLRPNRSEASSSRPISPPKGEDLLPPSNPVPHSRDVPPLPNANVLDGSSSSAKPESSRAIIRPQPSPTITPLSNIGMSLESDTILGFSSRVSFYSQQYRHGHKGMCTREE